MSLSWSRPDLFDIGVKVDPPHRILFDGYIHRLSRNCYMTHHEQAASFRHAIYVEGWCGWADRLKTLLMYGSCILLQQTPCGEYFKDLLRPYIHYVPVEGTLADLISKMEWLKAHPGDAQRIAKNALAFTDRHLSQRAISCYGNLVLAKYVSLYSGEPIKDPLSFPWEP